MSQNLALYPVIWLYISQNVFVFRCGILCLTFCLHISCFDFNLTIS